MSKLRALVLLLAVVLADRAVAAKEFFPLPDFANHEIPSTYVPDARAVWREWIDVAALAGGLALASYLALVRRSRRGLLLLGIGSLAWLGFWRKGCICPIGAIQNISMGACDATYAVPLAVIAFFALPLVFALFFGRTFCAAVCPLGAVQELVAVRPVKVPAWLDHTLGIVPYVYLGAGVLFATAGTFVICRYDPFVGFFRLGASAGMIVFGGALLVIGIFVGRPYCRYLCPLGAILGMLSRVSQWHVKIPPQDCVRCRLCEDVCPYGAIYEPTVEPSRAQRPRQRRRLALLLAALPLAVGLGAWLGAKLEVPLARLDARVQLAERVRLEELGKVQGTTDASEAFRNTGRPTADLYRDAMQITQQLGWAARWFGAWVGLVVMVKLMHLSVRRRRTGYEPNRSACVSCGRCFWYCPQEQDRLGLVQPLPAEEGVASQPVTVLGR